METNCCDFKFRKNKIYNLIIDVAFPVILLAFAMVNVNKGLDISDTAYNPGNFRYFFDMDGMWKYSTLLSNVLGYVLTFLPFGKTMLGIKIYTSLVKAITSLVSYWFFTKKVGAPKEVAFLGNLIALGLCWAPSTSIYHYLSYQLLCFGAFAIFMGFKKEKDIWFVVAGIILALNMFARFPNITNVALIVVVWYACIIKKVPFMQTLQKTGFCMAGYVGTVAIFFGLITWCAGSLSYYFTGVSELFAMTDEAYQYGIKFTIVNLINSYTCVYTWMARVVLVGAVCFAAGLILKQKAKLWQYVGATAATVALLAWLYKLELFDFNYYDTPCWYLFGVVILIVISLECVWCVFCKKFTDEERIIAMAALVTEAVTPLGTNNSLYATLNDMWILMPMGLYLTYRMLSWKGLKAAHAFTMTFLLAFGFQCVLFGTHYVFRDGGGAEFTATVENNKVLKGMKTTEDVGKMLNELNQLWIDEGLGDGLHKLLTFGDIPGLAYYMDTRWAIDTTWPSLQSYSVEKFAKRLSGLEQISEMKGVKYTVAIYEQGSSEIYDAVTQGIPDEKGQFTTDLILKMDWKSRQKKEEILKNFLINNNYKCIYHNYDVYVYVME